MSRSLRSWLLPAVSLSSILLLGCDSQTYEDKAEHQLEADIASARSAAMADTTSNLERQDREWTGSKGQAPHGLAVCKASIGILMSQDPGRMRGQEMGENRFSVACTGKMEPHGNTGAKQPRAA